MNPQRLVPLISTDRLDDLRTFYTSKLGFRVIFDGAGYLGMKAAGDSNLEVGFMVPCGEGENAFGGKGLTLCLQVDDVDSEHDRLREAGVPVLQPPEDKPWGDRCCVVADPIGIALYIHRPGEPSPEMAQHVTE